LWCWPNGLSTVLQPAGCFLLPRCWLGNLGCCADKQPQKACAREEDGRELPSETSYLLGTSGIVPPGHNSTFPRQDTFKLRLPHLTTRSITGQWPAIQRLGGVHGGSGAPSLSCPLHGDRCRLALHSREGWDPEWHLEATGVASVRGMTLSVNARALPSRKNTKII